MVCNFSLGKVRTPVDLFSLVWIVSSEQLLAWTQNPTPVANVNDFAPFQCSTPQVDARICDGIPANEAGLLSQCLFSDFPFYTCVSGHSKWNRSLLTVALQYGCPTQIPTPFDPNPEQSVRPGQQPRIRCEFRLCFHGCPAAHFSPSTC